MTQKQKVDLESLEAWKNARISRLEEVNGALTQQNAEQAAVIEDLRQELRGVQDAVDELKATLEELGYD